MPDRVHSVTDLLVDVGKCTVVDGITCKNQGHGQIHWAGVAYLLIAP